MVGPQEAGSRTRRYFRNSHVLLAPGVHRKRLKYVAIVVPNYDISDVIVLRRKSVINPLRNIQPQIRITFTRRSEFILHFILRELYLNWELCGKMFSDTHGSCLCTGKNELALLCNWLQIFRLSTSAWNTKEQNQYQDSLCIL
jgi:hypothetical protein